MSSSDPTPGAATAPLKRDVVKLPHHEQLEVCTSRPAYRQGKKLTAVKVYTASSESQHLVVSGVPALGLAAELRRLAARYGAVRSLVAAPRFDSEPFTDAFHVQFARVASARHAKRQLDGRNFYGGLLLAAFAPEMESPAETRAKLDGRRRDVARRSTQPTMRRQRRPLPSEEWPAASVLASKRQRIDAEKSGAAAETSSSRVAQLANALPAMNTAATVATPATVATTMIARAGGSLKLVPRQVAARKQIVYRNNKANS